MVISSSFIDHIKGLISKKNELKIIVCARDNIGNSLTDEAIKCLKLLGIKNNLSKASLGGITHRGFIFITEYGNPKIEILGDKREDVEYDDDFYEVYSPVYKNHHCEMGYVYIPTIADRFNLIAGKKRGLHIVALSKDDHLVSSVCFDTHIENSPPTSVISASDFHEHMHLLKEYKNFRKSFKKSSDLPELKVALPDYPYGETVFVFGKNIPKIQIEGFKTIGIKNGKKQAYLISTLPIKRDINNKSYIFSGHVISPDYFIWGEEDLDSNTNILSYCDNFGDFELIYFDDKEIHFETDFFGFGKWFYYKKEDVIVVSSSYHLLLKTLSDVKIDLSLNQDYIHASMGVVSWFTQQSFSDEMEIKDVFLLPPDKKICINLDGIFETKYTQLYYETYYSESWNDEKYEFLLNSSKNELVSSMTKILEHPAFNNAIIDLTDGLDTRTCLAILISLPIHLQKKVKCYSIENHVEDFKTASGFINMFNLRWESFTREATILPQSEGLDASPISYQLGTYHPIMLQTSIRKSTTPNTIRLTGGCGETCTGLAGQMYEELPSKEYIDWLLKKQVNKALLGTPNAVSSLVNILDSYLSAMPETTCAADQADVFYLHYRNRLHFQRKYQSGFLNPIQSISAYRAKKMSFKRGGGSFFFQHELIRVLNPIVAAFPYLDSKQNDRVNDIERRGLYYLPRHKVNLVPDYSKTPRIKPSTQHMPNENEYLHDYSKYKHKEDLYKWVHASEESLLVCLSDILSKMPWLEDVAFEYFCYIKNSKSMIANMSGHTPQVFKSKLLSLYYQTKVANI